MVATALLYHFVHAQNCGDDCGNQEGHPNTTPYDHTLLQCLLWKHIENHQVSGIHDLLGPKVSFQHQHNHQRPSRGWSLHIQHWFGSAKKKNRKRLQQTVRPAKKNHWCQPVNLSSIQNLEMGGKHHCRPDSSHSNFSPLLGALLTVCIFL